MSLFNNMELAREMTRSVGQLNRQIEAFNTVAKEMGIKPERLLDSHGNWVMAPVLAAKGQLLAAMANLNNQR